jgi:elongation factor G
MPPGNDWKFEGVAFPEPKYRTAIKAQSESDDEKLGESLNKIHLRIQQSSLNIQRN